MERPRARLEISEVPTGIRVELPCAGTRLPLDPTERLRVRLAGMPGAPTEPPPYAVRVCTYGADGKPDGSLARLHELGWSGRTNVIVFFDPSNGWTAEHAGHTAPSLFNGEPFYGARRLSDGDRIEPARGLVLTFTLERE